MLADELRLTADNIDQRACSPTAGGRLYDRSQALLVTPCRDEVGGNASTGQHKRKKLVYGTGMPIIRAERFAATA